MTPPKSIRIVAVLGAGLVLATAGATYAGVASADAVGPATGKSNAYTFERSVSGSAISGNNVAVGDTVTITNTVARVANSGWLLASVQDDHPECFIPVPETSTWTVSGQTYTNATGDKNSKPKEVTAGNGWVKLKPTLGSWEATPQRPLVWSQDYTVNCEIGAINSGGLQWSSTSLLENGKNKQPGVGPTLNVVAPKPGGNGNGNGDGGGAGSLDFGSLSGLFGSS